MEVQVRWTSRSDGDFADPRHAPTLPDVPQPYTWLRQVHGTTVVVVEAPGAAAGEEADAAVTAVAGCAVMVRTADCAPVVLQGDGAVGVAHAGWRGLLDGVVQSTADAMRELGHPCTSAYLGPCIGPECYEFGADDLDAVVGRYGDAVRGRTSWGNPALDLAAGVRAALGEVGVDNVEQLGSCTACDQRWYSHRARGEAARFATAAWLHDPLGAEGPVGGLH